MGQVIVVPQLPPIANGGYDRVIRQALTELPPGPTRGVAQIERDSQGRVSSVRMDFPGTVAQQALDAIAAIDGVVSVGPTIFTKTDDFEAYAPGASLESGANGGWTLLTKSGPTQTFVAAGAPDAIVGAVAGKMRVKPDFVDPSLNEHLGSMQCAKRYYGENPLLGQPVKKLILKTKMKAIGSDLLGPEVVAAVFFVGWGTRIGLYRPRSQQVGLAVWIGEITPYRFGQIQPDTAYEVEVRVDLVNSIKTWMIDGSIITTESLPAIVEEEQQVRVGSTVVLNAPYDGVKTYAVAYDDLSIELQY